MTRNTQHGERVGLRGSLMHNIKKTEGVSFVEVLKEGKEKTISRRRVRRECMGNMSRKIVYETKE